MANCGEQVRYNTYHLMARWEKTMGVVCAGSSCYLRRAEMCLTQLEHWLGGYENDWEVSEHILNNNGLFSVHSTVIS